MKILGLIQTNLYSSGPGAFSDARKQHLRVGGCERKERNGAKHFLNL